MRKRVNLTHREVLHVGLVRPTLCFHNFQKRVNMLSGPMQWSLISMQVWRGRQFASGSSEQWGSASQVKQVGVTALQWLHVDDVTCEVDGRVTGLSGRQTSLDDCIRLKCARLDNRQDFGALLLLRIAKSCFHVLGEDGANKSGTTARNATVGLANMCVARHDSKLDDETELGALERDPCIACGRIASPYQLCPMCLLHTVVSVDGVGVGDLISRSSIAFGMFHFYPMPFPFQM